MPPRYKLLKIGWLLLIFFIILLGFILIGISFLPFQIVKVKINSFAADGQINYFTLPFFNKIVNGLRLIGGGLFIVSIIFYKWRQQISKLFFDILSALFYWNKNIIRHSIRTGKAENKIHIYTLFIIIFVGIAVRLMFLFQPIRYDEAFTFLNYASKPLYIGLSNYSFPNNHLFHTFWVHISWLLFGNKLWAIRLPALLTGIAIIPVSYITIRLIYNKYAALLTVSIIAVSSILIEFSTNARGYSILVLIFLLTLVFGTHLKKDRQSHVWLLFTILSVLGFYTIPTMLYSIGIVIVWLFLSILYENTNLSRTIILKKLFFSMVGIVIFTIILYIPVLIVSGIDTLVNNSFVTPKNWIYFITNLLPSFHSVWLQWNRDIPSILSFILVVGFFISLIFHRQLTIHRVPLVLATVIWCIPILVFQRVVPYERVWIFLLPLYLGFASAGLSYPILKIIKFNRYKHVIFSILALTLSIGLSINVIRTKSVYYSEDTGTLRDAKAITIFLKEYLNFNDKVLGICPSSAPLMYYFKLYNIPLDYLTPLDLNSSTRILIIVNKPTQTLKSVLRESKISLNKYSSPKLIKQYKFAILYEMNRLSGLSETR
ncbi:MAG: glycosyltransferase family 39 protein [bacterium]|nr:glycosyltransferase family 39 protein [bacterium]